MAWAANLTTPTIYGALNLITLLLMGYDKSMAKASGRRIPEATLILLAAIGGALGGTAGMLWFHHKISKPKFYIAFPLLAIIHVAVVFYVFLTT